MKPTIGPAASVAAELAAVPHCATLCGASVPARVTLLAAPPGELFAPSGRALRTLHVSLLC